MREIIFRAYQKDFKRICSVINIGFCRDKIRSITVDTRGRSTGYDHTTYSDGDEEFPLSSLALMQYTGLKDKNDTKIFEGDILRIAIKDSEDNIEYKFGAVEYSTRSLEYLIRTKEGLVCGFGPILNGAGFYEFELEVIGNIHE